jgi:hypothetical protein
MRAHEFLIEAGGGMWDRMLEKKYGQDIKFKKGEEVLDLVAVEVFPQDKRTTYKIQPSAQPNIKDKPVPVDHRSQMIDDINFYIKSQKATLDQTLNPTPRNGAAMVVILGNQTKKLAFVKFADFKGGDRRPIYWQTSQFTVATGWAQTGKGVASTQKSAPLKLDPYKLVTAGAKYPIKNLVNVIKEKLETRTDIGQEYIQGVPAMLADLYKGGTPVPTPNLNEQRGVIEVVLGETAAPIAMATGNRVSGAYQECEKEMLIPMGLTWKDFKEVAFGAHAGEISDSTIYAGENKFIVSSKNQTGGANASLTGAMETVKKYPEEFGPKTKFYTKYKKLLPMLEILDKETNLNGILQLSVLLGILTVDEISYLKSILGRSAKFSSIKKYSGLMSVYKVKAILGQKVKNKKGQTVISKKGVDLNNPKYDLGYHLFSCVVKLVADHLNQDLPLITSFFKAVLNKADMVQVYTTVSANDKGIWFQDFKVVWPPTFTGNIKIDYDFNTSTALKTKKLSFTFD